MSNSRHRYTQQEDEHLVEYLATQAIGFQATRGNQLYMKLVDDVQKWPWAKSRSWQSWRDRYVKNQDTFNISIKRYRKKMAVGKEFAVINLGKREHESDKDVAVKRPKFTDSRDEAQEDNDRTKDKARSEALPSTKQAVTVRPLHSEDSGSGRREPTTVQKEVSKAKDSTSKMPVSLFTQESDEESDSQETPGPDDYGGEIFGDDVQEQVIEQAMDTELGINSDHDPADVNEVAELLTPSQSKISHKILPSPRLIYPDISQLPSPHLRTKEDPPPAASNSDSKSMTKQDHLPRPLNRPLRKRHPSSDSGFFESPVSSSRAPSPQRVRQLPCLTEGPFGGHRLASGRKRGGSSSDSDSEPKETWPPVRGKAKRRLTALEKGKGKTTEEAVTSEAVPFSSPFLNQRPSSRHAIDRYNSVDKLSSSLPPFPERLQHVLPSIPRNVGSSNPRPRSLVAPSDDGDEETMSKLLSDGNPFVVPPAPEKPVPFLDLCSITKKPPQRRYTLAAPAPPRIDLRKEAFKRASRKSLPGTSISAPVLIKDSMTELGRSLMRSWTRRFGLPEDRVRKVWEEELSIENTEKRLQHVKHEHEKSLTPTKRVKKKSAPRMDIDVLPDNEDINGYEPPYLSRARRFAKLSKQGRVKEALDRDRWLASEGRVKSKSPLKKVSPLWGKTEDELLLNVNTHNANSLRELEKKVGYAFMLEKVRDVALLNLA
ncbi:uncharacterized protein BT62DRAFT_51355 [Guyanagaster necrorhizus]|uniref:TERF2-interacting telomeric protein 1 Myb domain-containing protein n=1 Tax=Guyanagaster necrorhizus TaxID=856835 RepID=A0A9P8AZ60_9AGAR|nr:uncharacterized protein BT62DRAFT_51355 [Guyanagaster necrorhizus MCA 3950]KAG7453200.1 hypothetical protein BT62DRAFT_51355 [Guyanagaster necrorhizus MCA 3950]